MQTRDLEDFFPLVLPNAPAVPVPVAEQCLRQAAVEFCERTRCWRHMVTRTVRRDVSTVVTPSYAVIHEIESATFDGVRLQPTQFSHVEQGQDPASLTGSPRYITQSEPGTVMLIPFQEGTLILSLFLKPRSGVEPVVPSAYSDGPDVAANVVPEFLYSQFGEVIAAGALSRILALPNQTYTDPNRAGFYLAKFERAADSQFHHHIKGEHRAAARTRPSYF